MTIKIETDGDFIDVYTPYNRDFIQRVKSSIRDGRWEPNKECWTFHKQALIVVKHILKEVFGWEEGSPQLKIRIIAKRDLESICDSVKMANVPIARAWSRDGGARVAEGVLLESGSMFSGGSVRNWKTIVKEGAQFILEVPEFITKNIDSDYWDWEQIEAPSKDKKSELEEERAQLMIRLKEIEEELSALS